MKHNKKKIRVMHLLCTDQFSGAENVACQIIKLFEDDDCFEMFYCSPDGKIRQSLMERGVCFVPVERMDIRSLRRTVKKTAPDIIHAHDMRASFLASLVCREIPIISHIHINNIDSRNFSLKSVLYSYAARKARHILWVSQAAYSGYKYHYRFVNKSSVLRNVIDLSQTEERANQALYKDVYDVVFLGRLTVQKNPLRAVDVLESAIESCPDLQAAFIGSGELEAQLKAAIKERELSRNIHCLGFLDNPLGILKNAKLLLMTSLWEGLPMCALEAMSLGVPVVCTPADGLNEFVTNGETGFRSDDDDDLACACVNIISDKALFEKLRKGTKAYANSMDIDQYKHTLSQIYHLEG